MSNHECQVGILINNQEVLAQNYAEIRDPGKLTDVVGRVAVGNAEDVDKAVQVAHEAFLAWRKTDVKERIEKINAAVKVVQD